jgi:hypothetical protein
MSHLYLFLNNVHTMSVNPGSKRPQHEYHLSLLGLWDLKMSVDVELFQKITSEVDAQTSLTLD